MLKSLSIKNLALIEKQEIEFDQGLNIILGETGAGKSLIFDALFFVLSLKTDKTLLRTGSELMRVDAQFYPLSQSVKEILASLEIEDDELILSRSLHADGRSSIKINGLPCAQSTAKRLAAELVDSFMQHEGMEILKSKNHLSYLDKFCEFGDLKNKLAVLLSEKKDICSSISSLGGSDEDRLRRKDILTYQIDEIEKADVKIGEDDEIEARIKLLESSQRITENLSEVATLLDGNGGAIQNLGMSERLLSKLSDIDNIAALAERISSAAIEVDDITSEIKDVLSNIGSDPNELDRLDSRRDKLKMLKRKYGGTLENVLENLEIFKKELDDLDAGAEKLERLNEQLALTNIQISSICAQIKQAREKGAVKIKQGLEKELHDLGMKDVRFEVMFKEKAVSVDGNDDVSFVFSANKGQELKDLAKTASGGESSRIMLAMKNMFARADENRTLLFDEIDSGISGEVGNMMALKLKSISTRDQVIAITHLPQVAASGDHFYKVEKHSDSSSTYSEIRQVEGTEIISEIAHIIGGNNLTDAMLKNAEELYQRGRK